MGFYTVNHTGSTRVDGRKVRFEEGEPIEDVKKGDLDHISGAEWHDDGATLEEQVNDEHTVDSLKEALDEAEVEYTSNDKKADLVELYIEHVYEEGSDEKEE